MDRVQKRSWQLKQLPALDKYTPQSVFSQPQQDKRIFVKESKTEPIVPSHDLIKQTQ